MDDKTRTTMKRILAVIGLIIIFAMIIGLVVCIFTGADKGVILSLLLGLMVFPAFIFGLMIFAKSVSGKK